MTPLEKYGCIDVRDQKNIKRGWMDAKHGAMPLPSGTTEDKTSFLQVFVESHQWFEIQTVQLSCVAKETIKYSAAGITTLQNSLS